MSKQQVQIDTAVHWMVARLDADEEHRWLGVCDALNLTVEGTTFAELMESIGDTLNAVLLDLHAESKLHEFLTKHGWSVVAPAPTFSTGDDLHFDLPFIPEVVSDRDLHAHVH